MEAKYILVIVILVMIGAVVSVTAFIQQANNDNTHNNSSIKENNSNSPNNANINGSSSSSQSNVSKTTASTHDKKTKSSTSSYKHSSQHKISSTNSTSTANRDEEIYQEYLKKSAEERKKLEGTLDIYLKYRNGNY